MEEKLKVYHNSKLDELQEVYLAFKDNINSIVSTATIPDIMARGKANLEIFNSIRTQESILSMRDDIDTEDQKKDEKAAANKLHKKVHERFLAERETLKGKNQFRLISAIFLKDLSDSETFEVASKNLLNQCALSTWAAFEIFCRDCFIVLLNKNSQLVENLSAKAELKQKFNLKNIPVQKLIEFDFNLSNSMGTILIENFEFSNLRTIKTIYKTIFTSDDLREKLDDDKLWSLFQRRNLLAHKSGIVDTQYLRSTNESLPLKSKIWTRPNELMEYLELVIETSKEIRMEIENYCA
ncbi:hypothetical protein LB465_14075 [Salegentibacter sp. LM13S]|uniref:hypothetical protein n=1 Tax=Salegentibacter lacus TaxID=2873599 RepID=UPI001CCF4B2E|nr:hypothetical protein [Salegentibacter lacus]MBZ9631912.1 hypothetical protein [Salegentibacter lacus]